MNYKKCPYCGSQFVCWNAYHFGGIKHWWYNFKLGTYMSHRTPWKFITERWSSECWDCSGGKTYMFKVRTGMPYEMLRETYILSSRSIVEGYMEMIHCQIHNWLFNCEHKKEGEVANTEFYKKVCLEQIENLFKEEIDFTKIRGDVRFKTPQEYAEHKEKIKKEWEEKHSK